MDLFYEKQQGFDKLSKSDLENISLYGEGYKTFLDEGKTERHCVKYITDMAIKNGFKEYTGQKLVPGDKIYAINHKKAMALAIIGSDNISSGTNITAAHLDVPRIDIRNIPLYEDSEMAFFKTHYYGGIKKYQWLAIPLELHGTIVSTKDGVLKSTDISIGKNPSDPVFTITDLLPHLAADQMKKTLYEGITGEGLNILIGSTPAGTDKDKQRFKLWIMQYLNKEYGITEHDFMSAEICAVPAFNARDIGFDRSLIGAYGHDDRVCSYAAATALFDLKNTPKRTAICMLVDKEEIGSEGITGMQSLYFDTFVQDIAGDTPIRRVYENSICLSADVGNAYDPNFPEVSEKRNDARINCGLILTKYTGSRGKGGASDASAELMANIRLILEKNNVLWQAGQLGRVDMGGGGTVAKYMANRGIETVDSGVAVLSMHSPFELISKLDLYMAYKGFAAFYER